MISKILKFKEVGITYNRQIANFHGAVLATDVGLVIKLVMQTFLMVIFQHILFKCITL